jgi:hypothetical protein
MIMRESYKLLRSLTAILFLSIIFTGTGNAALIKFNATIDGAQANAGAGSGSLATGVGMAWLDDVTLDFSWNVSWSGLTDVTVAHFHGPASPFANAGAIFAIDINNPSIGNTTLNAGQVSDLMNGLWYINIHTQNFPEGEIRGQVLVDVATPASILLFAPALLGLLFLRRQKLHH